MGFWEANDELKARPNYMDKAAENTGELCTRVEKYSLPS
jgi:hypothetical protein